jgi:hypothetical protein
MFLKEAQAPEQAMMFFLWRQPFSRAGSWHPRLAGNAKAEKKKTHRKTVLLWLDNKQFSY